MRTTGAIVQRELMALFYSPIGYIVLAGFLLITGVLVLLFDAFAPGKPASLRELFRWTPLVLTFVVPAITMRMLSEEYRSGTMESLMTAPVSDFVVVFGKYLAAVLFYVFMLAGTAVYLVLMAVYGRPDWGASLSAYAGLLLMGMLFIAVSMFTSSLTKNQMIAWLLGAVPLLLFAWLSFYVSGMIEYPWLRTVFEQINVMGRVEEFARGRLSLEAVVFFLASSALFVFLAVKVVESKRWR